MSGQPKNVSFFLDLESSEIKMCTQVHTQTHTELPYPPKKSQFVFNILLSFKCCCCKVKEKLVEKIIESFEGVMHDLCFR